MVSVTGVEWVTPPAVPFTMTVTVCLAVIVDELEPPPQPSATRDNKITIPNPATPTVCFHRFAERLPFSRRPAKTIPASPSPESGIQAIVVPVSEYPEGGVTATAEMVRVEVVPGVMLLAEKLQVSPAGAFGQDKVMALLKPATGLAPTVSMADPPGVMVAFCEESVSEKFGCPATAAGVSVANSPLV